MTQERTVAVLLAAGRGERMKSDLPKVLHELLGRPLVHYVLAAVRAAEVSDAVVVTGHRAEDVEKAVGAGVRFVRQDPPKGTGHAVSCCAEALKGHDGEVLVLCGDAPLIAARTIKRLVGLHRSKNADVTFLTASLDNPAGYGRVVRDPAGRVQRIVEEKDADAQQKFIREINSGTYVFRAAALWKALEGVAPRPNGEVYLTDTVEKVLAAGGAVEALVAENPWEAYGINSRTDLVAATNWLRWQVLQRHMAAGVTVVDPSTTYVEEDVEIGTDTTLYPFTVIRHGVRIGSRCKVGPFAHLRDATVLEDEAEIGNFVEVKKSRVGRHSKAKHLTYLGDATLGERVNIGAGTITANYDGKAKHATIVEDGAFTGCNTVLVAPVRMGKNSKTGAGAVVPARQDVPEGAVVVGVPARRLIRGHPVGGRGQ